MSWAGLAAVGGGAMVGAWLRWLLGIVLNPIFPTLPLGTLASNLVGAWLMGLIMGYLSHFQNMSPEARLLLTTGFLGGLTTFSTFSAEITTLILRAQYFWAAGGILLHLAGSLAMTLMGIATVAWIKTLA